MAVYNPERDYLDAIDSLLGRQKEWQEREGDVWGLDTGLDALNYATGGLHAGELTILAARTSHGKTALANQIAFHVVDTMFAEMRETGEIPGQVLIVTPEMTMEGVLMRRACSMARVRARRIKRGVATDEEVERWRQAMNGHVRKQAPLLQVVPQGVITIDDIQNVVDRTASDVTKPLKLVVVDYVQQIKAAGSFSGYERTAEVSVRLGALAKDANVPVLAVSQLSRPGNKPNADEQDPKPTILDMRESGRLEEAANNIWLLWREKMTDNPDALHVGSTSKAELRIGKSRDGSLAYMPLEFIKGITTFTDGGPETVVLDDLD